MEGITKIDTNTLKQDKTESTLITRAQLVQTKTNLEARLADVNELIALLDAE